MLSGDDARSSACSGHPLTHSLSPRMQNAAFAAAGLDWAYVPLGVEPARLEEAVRGLVALGFAGANVTIPHKTAVLASCDELDEVAERAGSVNTLVIRDGRVLGSSTDGLAVTDAVEAEGAQVLVLGAGGAAQAVATALVDAGLRLAAVAARTRGACACPGRPGCAASLPTGTCRPTAPGRRARATPTSSSTRRRFEDELLVDARRRAARSSTSPTGRTEARRR